MNAEIERWKNLHESASMVGWDFSRLDGSLTAQKEPWDFEADCLRQLASATSALDMGTGGGERLIALLDQLGSEAEGKRIVATEGWEPNIPVARENLAPYGVEVVAYDPEQHQHLDADDSSFDLIMNRHEAIDADQIARVLAPSGVFMTQQVSGFDVPEIHEWFDAPFLYPRVTLKDYSEQLNSAGLTITLAEEWEGAMTFVDVEALVTYLGLVPWDVPDFTVEKHADKLLELNRRGSLTVTQRRFRVRAVNE